MRSVIFDLDGTLADTSLDMINAGNAALEGIGIAGSLGPDDAGTAFGGGMALMNLGFQRAGRKDVPVKSIHYPLFIKAYWGALSSHTVLYPGVADAIEGLRSAGYAVGICTNKPAAPADELLRRLGVRDLFGSLVGADTLPVKKPDPAPLFEAIRRLGADLSRGCLVGDTITDFKTARAAGVPSVLVTFGPGAKIVADLAPDATISSYVELTQVIDRLNL
ncbi:phosphoglycolate phosphatase [Ketogulonicigenium vulgare]|uniref:phosphoglycolate phosphatase n=1 Tax=Ketogulonicigenium vulgare (strain WSH-001) TaxID=759362 RepID=F9Y3X5_KETVW|nr:phosphoglycolate phosphatase [Ketogulonicigenium vulgare]ADO43381.1 phosphoglycolate phosphatase [Ketogulonicigenium vulgare Y25]AEM41666.1 Haloacid dehalogenase-like protein hydrolase, putative [Ketogulonicigenium vulgare WSH-001]ALJ81777.1 haloacid dehalogenase [Ketogulonicigenium vulgare]ANW34433.1 haloacid dehalogenase [Ketogulonicigenium vulgare]AOZ55416.1 phosphoglycolate phosphatase [Ketogulonicigenium vulgare]